MYVADWSDYKQVMTMTVCTKAEEKRAGRAYDLARASGYPSVS